MGRIAGVPVELRSVADRARYAGLEFAAASSFLGARWLPAMPPGLRSFVDSVTSSAATELRDQATQLMAEAVKLDEAAYWFELADETSGISFAELVHGRAAMLDKARAALQSIGADASCVPALSSWSLAEVLGLASLQDASVEDIARLFSEMSHAQRDYLVVRFPQEIGGLDGAPLGMRYAANRSLILAAVEDLEAEVAQARADLARMRELGRLIAGPLGAWALEHAPLNPLQAASDRLAFLEKKLDVVRSWAADESRRFLLFDPSGDGRVAEVFGPLAKAEHVAVLVPGMNNDLTKFDGFGGNADRLFRSADFWSPGEVATIAWLGYDTPTVKDVAFSDKAMAAAPLLDRFVDGIRTLRDDTHITVVAHSYGGVATGRSLQQGLAVDDAVFVGAPGTGGGVDDADDLRTEADLWAARAPFAPDVSLDDVRAIPVGPGAPMVVPDLNIGELEFVPFSPAHGEDPSAEGFGARRFRVNLDGIEVEAGADPDRDGVVLGHSEYFDNGTASLLNITYIVLDEDDLVDGY